MATDQKVWDNTYDGMCCERQEITPDGLTIVAGSNLRNFWYVIDARTGDMKGKIPAAATDAHNMALSADGKTVLMAPNGVTVTVGDVPSMKAIRTITFSDHVRPLVINHDATRVYANLNNLLGFEIADVKTGEVIKHIEAPAEMWKEKWTNRDKLGGAVLWTWLPQPRHRPDSGRERTLGGRQHQLRSVGLRQHW